MNYESAEKEAMLYNIFKIYLNMESFLMEHHVKFMCFMVSDLLTQKLASSVCYQSNALHEHC